VAGKHNSKDYYSNLKTNNKNRKAIHNYYAIHYAKSLAIITIFEALESYARSLAIIATFKSIYKVTPSLL